MSESHISCACLLRLYGRVGHSHTRQTRVLVSWYLKTRFRLQSVLLPVDCAIIIILCFVCVFSLEGRFEDEELQQILDDIQTKRSFQYWDQDQSRSCSDPLHTPVLCRLFSTFSMTKLNSCGSCWTWQDLVFTCPPTPPYCSFFVTINLFCLFLVCWIYSGHQSKICEFESLNASETKYKPLKFEAHITAES